LVITNVLNKTFFNILSFTDIYSIRSIIFFAKKKIDTCVTNILSLARGDFDTRYLYCFTIPV